jgi:hypothetical protein
MLQLLDMALNFTIFTTPGVIYKRSAKMKNSLNIFKKVQL